MPLKSKPIYIIRPDETYYRWNASTNQFEYIGEAGGGVNVVQTTGTSTTATAYMCVAVDDVAPAYTWEQITA